ncbi:MAG: hypothetical protein KC636_37575 [Myxococcales bacterium]|nr:hypothetical protein [Myxococcales bacterium]
MIADAPLLTSVLAWRLIKFIALLLAAAGTAGAFLPERLELRQRSVYGLATVGLALLWIAGMGLVRAGGYSLGTPWLAGSTLLSIVWLQLLASAVERPERRSLGWALASTLALVAALALMVLRPG